MKLRRNALAPISSLPPEVFAVIFSFVRLPSKLILAEEPDRLACLRVSHVCHQWREIALNQPLLWSHVDFTLLTSAGATEILARAKTVPLHLEANVPIDHWDNSRFEYHHLSKTLEGLVSPAPTLEDLSLSCEGITIQPRVFVPDNIFDGTTPRLLDLVLKNCDISWNSPLLKGLRYLEIRTPSASWRPSLSVWLDALDQIPQLKTLTLHSASPIAPPFSFDVERTVTLPSLVYLDIAASARDCGLALAHLVLPALTWLGVVANLLIGMVATCKKSSHMFLDTPMDLGMTNRSRACSSTARENAPTSLRGPSPIWTAKCAIGSTYFSLHTARVSFAVTNENWFPGVDAGVFDAAMAALPLDNFVTLTAQNRTRLFEKQVWLHHAPRWPLLQSVRLAPQAARGLREMFLEDSGGNENPLLPSLRKLVLINAALSAYRTLRLRDAFMKRVEQGVPLETLNLHTCPATSRAVELLREIVVDVWGPVQILDTREQIFDMGL
ncbi:hypothetical protein EDB86DRAFT_2084866 [Lactarius hatsudake]|nr:hypothetical protein EDB86DRAFT_2084866 [Lactarius hatsudake]